ncbi:Ribosomal-protein-alanine acetyltransferase [bioreactor metagenome]|uniref:Ribosomal-protein-alanine acetyltransferase n=1 Tax=bioreactor metagenome TaxID=1076179 RepID=A0A645GS82_9ZZZZ|nr:ribosomal protein S18-alanine N-acetyltransferase [Candidatus Pelethousia sp.]NCB29773.1 ribosomal-protein-alanine N-acetyltransferase [Clostridia bacterium]
MTDMHFRPMQKEDVARIAELERICFRSPWSEKALAGELKNPVARYRVGLVGEALEAYAGMWVIYDEAHITNVAVAPAFRRRGYGRAIMEEMLRTARLYGANQMTLEVRESNLVAQALYGNLGFETAGRRKRYYSDTGEDAFIMWNRDIGKTLAAFANKP